MFASLLPVTKSGPAFIQIPDRKPNHTRTERAVEVMMTLAWNLGAEEAYRYYCSYIVGTQIEAPVSWLIESRAFDGTAYADVFAYLCGDGHLVAPHGWESVEGGAC